LAYEKYIENDLTGLVGLPFDLLNKLELPEAKPEMTIL
jgi:hypothetical protein